MEIYSTQQTLDSNSFLKHVIANAIFSWFTEDIRLNGKIEKKNYLARASTRNTTPKLMSNAKFMYKKSNVL